MLIVLKPPIQPQKKRIDFANALFNSLLI